MSLEQTDREAVLSSDGPRTGELDIHSLLESAPDDSAGAVDLRKDTDIPVQFADPGESVWVPREVVVSRPTYRMRRAARRLRARKVRRLVRYVDPWSVMKMSVLFYLSLYLIALLAGVLLWNVAVAAGTIATLEGMVEDLFVIEVEIYGNLIFRAAALAGVVLVLSATAATVLLAILFNLISDLTGGIRMTVIEEETARPRPVD